MYRNPLFHNVGNYGTVPMDVKWMMDIIETIHIHIYKKIKKCIIQI